MLKKKKFIFFLKKNIYFNILYCILKSNIYMYSYKKKNIININQYYVNFLKNLKINFFFFLKNLHNFWIFKNFYNDNIIIKNYNNINNNNNIHINNEKIIFNNILKIKQNYFNYNYIFNEKKKLLNFFTSLFIKNNKTIEIINCNFIENINYINIFLNNYKILKILLNTININKLNYNIKKFNNFWYFKKFKLIKLNIINYYNIKNSIFFINKIYLQYQYKTIKWIINNIFLNYINNTIKNNKIFLNLNKYNKINYDIIDNIKQHINIVNYFSKDNNKINEIIIIIFLFIKYKDIKIFTNWIKKNLSILYYKKQLIFINSLNNILNIIFQKYKNLFNFIGYKIIIKGKLNKIGNVRKKKILLYNGKNNLTNLNYKSDYFNETIVTITGTIGIKITINYY